MANRTIHRKGTITRDEGAATVAILPGMLVERVSGGGCKPHATAGQKVAALIAVEDELQGNGITDAYAIGDRVQFNRYQMGDQFLARLQDGQNAAFGAALVSYGNGYLEVAPIDSSGTIVEHVPMFRALEAVDMSDSSGADPDGFILVEVL